MKKNLKQITILTSALTTALLFFLFACNKDPKEVLASVLTYPNVEVLASSAIVEASVESNGGTPITTRGICWSNSPQPSITDNKVIDNKVADGVELGTFRGVITGLMPGNQYYARAYAVNKVGVAYGSQVTINTQAILPTVTTLAITYMYDGTAIVAANSQTSPTARPTTKATTKPTTKATTKPTTKPTTIPTTTQANSASFAPPASSVYLAAGGEIISDGGAAITQRGVCWSTNPNPTIADSKTTDGSGSGSFTSTIIGLNQFTTYYVRAYATNKIGTAYGEQKTANLSVPTNTYQILKADLHMHTYYSDGDLSPAERVEEAINEKYDVIAITDHLEYRIYLKKHPGDHNQSYKEAIAQANNRIVIIKAAEISRSMPPGHVNAFFITDANRLELANVWDVLLEAKNQGAFFLWNHPGWTGQQENGAVWYDYHTNMLNANMLHGIEIYNATSDGYYPQAYTWATEKSLTVFANSDLHGYSNQNFSPSNPRPYTLIFAKDKTQTAIKAALLAGRTVAFFNGNYYGTDQELMAYFVRTSLTFTPAGNNITVTNNSNYTITFTTTINPQITVTLKPKAFATLDKNQSTLKFLNLFVSKDKNLVITAY